MDSTKILITYMIILITYTRRDRQNERTDGLMSLAVDPRGIPTGDEDALSDSDSECGEHEIPHLVSAKDPTIIITSDYEDSSSSDTDSEYETDSELLSDLDERYEESILKPSHDAGKTVRSSTRSPPTPKPDLTQLKVTPAYQVD